VKRAYAFSRAHDSDGDGIYENTEGTGWVESWPPSMPHQEIYLAALDYQSASSMSRLAGQIGDKDLATSAHAAADRIRQSLLKSYYEPASGFYAFSRNPDGSLDRTATIYPSVAWWDGRLALPQSGPMLERWASHEFSTDWGTRDVSERESMYDPISYHQGSVWPLFTAWVAMAEYRAGQPLSAYAHLMQNAGLTYKQDLGAITELLSGDLFEPLGRSSTHQTWSSAMTLSVALRGLFGLEWDAPHHTLRVAPQFPPSWERSALRNVHLGSALFDLEFIRHEGQMLVRATSKVPEVLCLKGPGDDMHQTCTSPAATSFELSLKLPEVEVGLNSILPLQGARTQQLKALSMTRSAHSLSLRLEAQGGSTAELPVRLNHTNVKLTGAELAGDRIRVNFPKGEGYRQATVEFAW
jgi:hypothetical protein